MLRCSATRAMTRTLHEPWPKPKRPPSAGDPPSQSAAPPENRRVNQPETVSDMAKKTAAKTPGEQTIRALLERHACPVAFHEARTRFLGNIATPELSASPLQTVKDLWGGELPVFDSLDDANELIGALIQGLWNDLTRHQKRSQPFRLTRVPMEPS